MKLITPVTVTDAMLVSSSIPETDHAAWNAATAYAAGARVIRTSTHSVYERLVPGTTAQAPEADPTNWIRVGPTNRWKMFDRATGTASSATDTITVTLAPGLVDSVALLDVVANTVTVTMTVDGDTIYTREIDLNAGDGVFDGYTYCFAPIILRSTAVLTDLPPFSNGQVTITVDGDGEVSVGTVVIGSFFQIGETQSGVGLGINDYSVKSTDSFGATTVTQRAYAKRMQVPVVLRSRSAVNEVSRRLPLVRALPCVWVADEDYDQSVIYGFFKDWRVDVQFQELSYCSLNIEGLS